MRTHEDLFWPLDAPGMPGPGPNFLRHAIAMGDPSSYSRKKVKGKEEVIYRAGPELARLYNEALRTPGFRLPIEVRANATSSASFVPGHIWGQHFEEWLACIDSRDRMPPPVDGPHRADVMVISKWPGREEASAMRQMVGPAGDLFTGVLAEFHLDEKCADWYVTTVCKYAPPEGVSAMSAKHVADCAPLLAMELRLVRPKYILCLGADATKAILGKGFGVGNMEGRVVPYTYQVNRTSHEEPEFVTAQVMTIINPIEAVREEPKRRIVQRGVARLSFLLQGKEFSSEDDIDHRIIRTKPELAALLREIDKHFIDNRTPKKYKLVGWDAEWEGRRPGDEGSWLRTIQIAWAPKKAACIDICDTAGQPCFVDDEGNDAFPWLVAALNRFMKGKRAVGHFFNADLEWLHFYGIDPIADNDIPIDPSPDGRAAWERFRDGEGWLSTEIMRHAIEETAPLGLENLVTQYTLAPRYDVDFDKYLADWMKARKMRKKDLKGYGQLDGPEFYRYACYDADVLIRIVLELMPQLDRDHHGNCSWEPCWETMIALPVILDMRNNAALVDRKRVDELSVLFADARDRLENDVRQWAEWPGLNLRSSQQVVELLFGEQYHDKRDKATGERTHIRPEGAWSLGLEPVFDTSKPKKKWSEIKERGLVDVSRPSTDKDALGLLIQEYPGRHDELCQIRDHRFADQALKQLLRKPKEERRKVRGESPDGDIDEEDENEVSWTNERIVGEDGYLTYDAGIVSQINDDGRVRTRMTPTAETGRWKSSSPNLHAVSKQRDEDYERILGYDETGRSRYKHKMRSVLMAALGWAFVEFDYKTAELLLTAVMSGDKNLLEHAMRANYPDEGFDNAGNPQKGGKFAHPRFYDIHSNVAVLAFGLKVNDHVTVGKDGSRKTASEILGLPVGSPCPATKFALKTIGKAHFRVLAKNVIFGIIYGRGAKAIAVQANVNRKPGDPEIMTEDAQAVIDTIFRMYPRLQAFFEACKERVRIGWIKSCYGRIRRVPGTGDQSLRSEFERQFMNFPIQSAIASIVNRALARLRAEIKRHGLGDVIKLTLQIHDAAICEVRMDYVEYVVETLLPYCVRDSMPIYPTYVDGTEKDDPDAPYYLGIDTAVFGHWGEPVPVEDAKKYGLPVKYCKSHD